MRIWISYLASANREDKLEQAEEASSEAIDFTEGINDFESNEDRASFGEESSSVFDNLGDTGGLFDEGIIFVIFALLVAVIFGSGFILLYEAPIIITEALLEFVLAASLIKRALLI